MRNLRVIALTAVMLLLTIPAAAWFDSAKMVDERPVEMRSGALGPSFAQQGQTLSFKSMFEVLEPYPECRPLVRKARAYYYTGLIVGIPAAVLFGIELGQSFGDDGPDVGALAISGAATGLGVLLEILAKRRMAEAVPPYNERIKVGANPAGAGLALQLRF